MAINRIIKIILFTSIMLFTFCVSDLGSLYLNGDDFSDGTFVNTEYRSDLEWLALDGTTLIGNYTTPVFDAKTAVRWERVIFKSASYSVHPDDNEVENIPSGYNMTDNTLLLHMDELSGNLTDTSGYAGLAEPYNVEYGVEGLFGTTALNFTGTSQVVVNSSVAKSTFDGYGLNDGFTIEILLKPDVKDASIRSAFLKPNTGGILPAVTILYTNTAAGCAVYDDVGNGVALAIVNGQYITVDEYNYIGCVVDFTTNITTVRVNNETNSVAMTNVEDYINSDLPVYIGGSNGWIVALNTTGAIDEVVLYSRPFSALELESHYVRHREYDDHNTYYKVCNDAACGDVTEWTLLGHPLEQELSVDLTRYIQFKFWQETDQLGNFDPIYEVEVQYNEGYNPITAYDDSFSAQEIEVTEEVNPTIFARFIKLLTINTQFHLAEYMGGLILLFTIVVMTKIIYDSA